MLFNPSENNLMDMKCYSISENGILQTWNAIQSVKKNNPTSMKYNSIDEKTLLQTWNIIQPSKKTTLQIWNAIQSTRKQSYEHEMQFNECKNNLINLKRNQSLER